MAHGALVRPLIVGALTALAAISPPALAAPVPDPGSEPTSEPTGAEPTPRGAKETIDPTPKSAPAPRRSGGPYPHKGQIGLSLRFALGYRAIATYNSEYCGALDPEATSGNAPVCTSGTPFTIDFEVAYGIARRVDLLLETRFGLGTDFGSQAGLDNGPHVVKLSPGFRLFFSEGKRSKLFTTGQLVVDLSGYETTGGVSLGNDIGVRNINGLWFDFAREWGVYGFVGETATFARWLNIELEFGIGIQGRYP